MDCKKKKVLIVGSSAKEYAVAKYLSKNPDIETIFTAPGNFAVEEFSKRVDIRENAVQELLEFAIKNDIDLTIASSTEAIKADIAGFFSANSQLIFAPGADSANFAIYRGAAKKFLYKLRIPTPKFGIFEKQQMAIDYVKASPMPILITTDEDNENSIRSVCSGVEHSKICISDIFLRDREKAVIEEYVYGHPFTFYVITDGYQALPLAVVGDYKFQEDGEAGLFTRGSGAFVPDYKVSFDIVGHLMENVVENILVSLQKRKKPYLGILGVECVLKSFDNYVVTGFVPFLKEHDAQAVISSVGADLYSVMEACANGAFADDYDEIPIKNICTLSCVLFARKSNSVITGLELVDDTTDVGHFNTTRNNYLEYLTNKGRTLVVTQTGSTFTRAKELLYDNIDEIYFEGMKYRHDICSE